MKIFKIILIATLLWIGCRPSNSNSQINLVNEKQHIDSLISNWHQNAAEANLQGYIGFMDSSCNYIGTDATENWLRDDFSAFCKPYFDKKTTWDFTTLQRDVQLNQDGNTAWFDEILDTHMGTCRGSGALEKMDGQWKLKQYVLSLAIPNEVMNEVKKVTHDADSVFQSNLGSK